MTRTEILNLLIKKYDYKTYLELGLGSLSNFKQVNAEHRQGVDRKWNDLYNDRHRVWYGDTDDFFNYVSGLFINTFDLIFIDADHRASGSCRDIFRAFSILNEYGTIVLHDVLPKTVDEAIPEKGNNSNAWCGEVWRNWAEFRRFKNVVSYVVNTDHGCGILQTGKNTNPFIGKSPMNSFEYIAAYGPDSYHNIISQDEFKARMA